MKNLGIGIETLSKFKNMNLVYVDKTEIIHKLLSKGQYYFLSRPRRFGKSLLVDAIHEIFNGNRELFKDLWIYDKWDFEARPVIKINFSNVLYNEEGLKKALELYLDKLGEAHNVSYNLPGYSGKFQELIEKLGKEKQVAILIDEYDKPIIDYLEQDKLKQAEENRKILKNFYQGVKGLDRYIKFLFITGVSKFSQVSIFSDLNHLRDISLNKKYSRLTGYTENEIRKYYGEHINILAEELELSIEKLFDLIREWYDGYSWDGKSFVYNPFSVLNLLDSETFKNFWFDTGTPTFLVNKIKEKKDDFSKIHAGVKVNESVFSKYDIEDIDSTALMFQTGYLTIKEYDFKSGKYLLDFPNKEVKDSFLNFSAVSYSRLPRGETEIVMERLIEHLDDYEPDKFITELKSLFASVAVQDLKHVKNYEGYYHSIVYIILKIIGARIDCEVQTNHGVTDAVVKTDEYIYVLEFKMGDAQEGMDQIKDNKYYEPYLSDKRKVILFAIGFDKEERNVGTFLTEEIA